ncbi:MAG: hypothetical protein U0797_18515 [Gemmataceae bacterium]
MSKSLPRAGTKPVTGCSETGLPAARFTVPNTASRSYCVPAVEPLRSTRSRAPGALNARLPCRVRTPVWVPSSTLRVTALLTLTFSTKFAPVWALTW